jgi:hypothetical protein
MSRFWFRPGWSQCSTSSAGSRISAVGVSSLRRLDQLLIRSIAVALAGRGRCGRENRGPHAFKEHGLAAVWIGRDVGGSRGSLILTAIRRRVLVGLNQLLVRPVVVGHARVCSTAPAVATRERAQRQPQISQRGSPSPPTMNLILSISSVDGRYKATLITRRSGASPGAAANGPAKSQRFGLSSALALPTVTSRTRTWA